MSILVVSTLLIWSLAIFYNDVRYHFIPNYLSFGGVFVAGVVLLLTGKGLIGVPVSSALLAFGLAIVLTLPGYAAKLLGAGDVKLLCAIGLLTGLDVMLMSFAVSSVAVVFIYFILPNFLIRLGIVICKSRAPKEKFIPFGAAMVAAMVAVVFLTVELKPI